MAASLEDITRWFNEGLEEKATHMLVVCDTFDWEDYPVYVEKSEKVRDKIKEYDGPNMQKVMEVYDLSKSRESQLKAGTRVWNV